MGRRERTPSRPEPGGPPAVLIGAGGLAITVHVAFSILPSGLSAAIDGPSYVEGRRVPDGGGGWAPPPLTGARSALHVVEGALGGSQLSVALRLLCPGGRLRSSREAVRCPSPGERARAEAGARPRDFGGRPDGSAWSPSELSSTHELGGRRRFAPPNRSLQLTAPGAYAPGDRS